MLPTEFIKLIFHPFMRFSLTLKLLETLNLIARSYIPKGSRLLKTPKARNAERITSVSSDLFDGRIRAHLKPLNFLNQFIRENLAMTLPTADLYTHCPQTELQHSWEAGKSRMLSVRPIEGTGLLSDMVT